MSSGVTTPVNQVVITATAGLTIPASNQTPVIVTWLAQSTPKTIYTVPANKKFYITEITIFNQSATDHDGGITSPFVIQSWVKPNDHVTYRGGIIGIANAGDNIIFAHQFGASVGGITVIGFLQ